MGRCKCGRRRFNWSPARQQSESPTNSPAMDNQSSVDMDFGGGGGLMEEEDPLKLVKLERGARQRSPSPAPSVVFLEKRTSTEISKNLGKITNAVNKLGKKFDGLSSKLTVLLESHDRRLNNVEQDIQQVIQRVHVLEQRVNINANVNATRPGRERVSNPNPNARSGRVICCYCNKDFSKGYLKGHKRRMHFMETLFDPQ